MNRFKSGDGNWSAKAAKPAPPFSPTERLHGLAAWRLGVRCFADRRWRERIPKSLFGQCLEVHAGQVSSSWNMGMQPTVGSSWICWWLGDLPFWNQKLVWTSRLNMRSSQVTADDAVETASIFYGFLGYFARYGIRIQINVCRFVLFLRNQFWWTIVQQTTCLRLLYLHCNCKALVWNDFLSSILM